MFYFIVLLVSSLLLSKCVVTACIHAVSLLHNIYRNHSVTIQAFYKDKSLLNTFKYENQSGEFCSVLLTFCIWIFMAVGYCRRPGDCVDGV